jgi:hypothetical protein
VSSVSLSPHFQSLSRSKIDREIDVELQAHIELRMEGNVAAAMSPEGRTLIPAGIGLIAGSCGVLLQTRLLRGELYGVEPNSFQIYAISAVPLLFPVLMAAARPALTAGLVNPVEALRTE